MVPTPHSVSLLLDFIWVAHVFLFDLIWVAHVFLFEWLNEIVNMICFPFFPLAWW
uniref:Uncharacterized protein n=1 Tax=Arundo donax TaxID=35708 RepID=A0A0A9B8D5_ARUDO